MIGRGKTEQDIARLQSSDGSSRDRYQDLQLAVYGPGSDRPILRVGGRWDTLLCKYDGAAETECVIRLSLAQWDAWPTIAQWLTMYVRARRAQGAEGGISLDEALTSQWGEDSPLFTLQLYGGRQGGKTHLGAVVLALVAVAVPGAKCPVVSTTAMKTEEIVDILERYCLRSDWRVTTSKRISLINGSTIPLFSGRVRDLKALGPIECTLLNEAQEQNKRNWTDLQGNTLARAGLVVLAQNPPRTALGQWTQDLYEKIVAGELPGGQCGFINPELNPHASSKAMVHLASTMGERERKRDVLGDMGVSVGDVALTSWSDSDHVMGWIPTMWEDVTEEVTRLVFGRAYARVGGLDWDKGPGPSFCVGRLFRPRGAADWAVTLAIEHGQRFRGMAEERFAGHLRTLEDKYGRRLADPATTIWVGDSSGRYQSSNRRFDAVDQPSWDRMGKEGWQVTYVDPEQKRNPRRVDRFDLINEYVLMRQPETNQPRVVMVAPGAKDVIDASKKLPRRKGEAARFHHHGHLVDTWTYLAWHLFSREYRAIVNGVPESVARSRERGPMG